MTSINKLKNIASQLRNPEGQKGLEMGEMMSVTNEKMICHSIDLLHISDNDNVLELGHGNCRHLKYILNKADNVCYTGLETSSLMFQEACRINQPFKDSCQATFSLYNGINIPFTDNTFDKIFTVNTIYFFEDLFPFLSEVYRVIKSGGIFNITFGQEETMKKMPYTQFDYTLYNTDKILEFIRLTPFAVEKIANDTEEIKKETKSYPDRIFTTVSLRK